MSTAKSDVSTWAVSAGWDQIVTVQCPACGDQIEPDRERLEWPTIAQLTVAATAHQCTTTSLGTNRA